MDDIVRDMAVLIGRCLDTAVSVTATIWGDRFRLFCHVCSFHVLWSIWGMNVQTKNIVVRLGVTKVRTYRNTRASGVTITPAFKVALSSSCVNANLYHRALL